MTTIRVPVTVRQTADGRFVARPAPVPDEAEGGTAEEAVARLQARAEPMTLPVTLPGGNPWLAVVGMWKDTDPELIAEWRKCVEENREMRDRDEFPPEDWTQPTP